MSAPAIGIDLGTTYSCVGVVQNGKVEIITNEQGKKTMPSVVAFTDYGLLVGEVAKNQAARNPENTVFDAKRMIGRKFNDEELQQDIKHWPFTVCDLSEPKIKVQFMGDMKFVTPVQIGALVLKELKKTAEAFLGKTVSHAVITVPAYFNNTQRRATKDAATLAGFEVSRIINEQTAAALAYGLDKKADREQRILIYDLGGGTFDVSILTIADNTIHVLASSGDTHLGGEDFDNLLVEHFSGELSPKYKKNIGKNSLAMRRLKCASEQAKRDLSSCSIANVEIESLYEGIDFAAKISRARFDELCATQFQRTLGIVERVLEDAKLERSSIDEVVLVGGSTRIPKIRKMLGDFFDGKHLNLRINADEAVAYGAAVQAAALSTRDPTPGANDHLLRDVVPFSLGVCAGGDSYYKLVERNSPIPIRREHEIAFQEGHQTKFMIQIYEGEHELARNNRLVGEFEMVLLQASRHSNLKVIVTFDIDKDGIMSVSAHQKGREEPDGITIRNLSLRDPKEFTRLQTVIAVMEESTLDEQRRRHRQQEERRMRAEEMEQRRRTDEERPKICAEKEEQDRQIEDEEDFYSCEESQGEEDDGYQMVENHDPEIAGRSSYGDRDSLDRNKARRRKDNQRNVLNGNVGPEEPEGGKRERRGVGGVPASGRKGDFTSGSTRPDHRRVSATTEPKQSDKSQHDKPQHGRRNRSQRDSTAPVDKMSDTELFAVEAYLAGKPGSSHTERLEIYNRCMGILEKVGASTNDPRVKDRCAALDAKLRERYGDVTGSYTDVTRASERKPS